MREKAGRSRGGAQVGPGLIDVLVQSFRVRVA